MILVSGFFNLALAGDDDAGTLAGGLDKAAKQGGLIAEGQETPTIAFVIGKYVEIASGLLGIAFMIIIVYAGLLWMFSAGQTENVAKARGWMVHGAIGFAICMMAYLASHFAITQIGAIIWP